jgi:hypothetical protein
VERGRCAAAAVPAGLRLRQRPARRRIGRAVPRSDPGRRPRLELVGKGGKRGKVALPSLARQALDTYLAQRGLPITRSRWDPTTPVLASLAEDGAAITSARLRVVLRRFFEAAAKAVEAEAPATAQKRSATASVVGPLPVRAKYACPRSTSARSDAVVSC